MWWIGDCEGVNGFGNFGCCVGGVTRFLSAKIDRKIVQIDPRQLQM